MDIYWLFNDYAINDYHGVTTSKIGKKVNVLTIDSVNGNNAGNYTCRARNNAQTVEYSAALIVNGWAAPKNQLIIDLVYVVD